MVKAAVEFVAFVPSRMLSSKLMRPFPGQQIVSLPSREHQNRSKQRSTCSSRGKQNDYLHFLHHHQFFLFYLSLPSTNVVNIIILFFFLFHTKTVENCIVNFPLHENCPRFEKFFIILCRKWTFSTSSSKSYEFLSMPRSFNERINLWGNLI